MYNATSTMFRQIVFPSALVLLTALLAAQPQESNQGTLRVISNLPGYLSPGGLLEASPGLFFSDAYLATAGGVVFTVTTKGSTTTITSFPSGYDFISGIVGGPNGRFFSAVEYGPNAPNVFSVTATPGAKQYPPQTIGPGLAQALPDGTFAGTGFDIATGAEYLVNCNDEGAVTSFSEFPSGDRPLGAFIYATDGNYYGLDFGAAGPYVYRATPAGVLTSLHSFLNSAFKGLPPTPLLQGSDGDLYGAAPYGGANGTGLVYRLSLTGQYSVVYTFPKGPAGFPTSLFQASDGNFYGTTYGNTQDPHGHSVMFRLTTSGQYTQLYAWPASACYCTLLQGSDGKIYGVAENAASFFVWEGGLPKPAPQALFFTPSSGAAGTQVLIWGYNLLSPSVSFNGVAAAKVTGSGPQYIRATVPAGATTGPITVTTPGGSYRTTTSFTVQ